jgi:hypothetical protein
VRRWLTDGFPSLVIADFCQGADAHVAIPDFYTLLGATGTNVRSFPFFTARYTTTFFGAPTLDKIGLSDSPCGPVQLGFGATKSRKAKFVVIVVETSMSDKTATATGRSLLDLRPNYDRSIFYNWTMDSIKDKSYLSGGEKQSTEGDTPKTDKTATATGRTLLDLRPNYDRSIFYEIGGSKSGNIHSDASLDVGMVSEEENIPDDVGTVNAKGDDFGSRFEGNDSTVEGKDLLSNDLDDQKDLGSGDTDRDTTFGVLSVLTTVTGEPPFCITTLMSWESVWMELQFQGWTVQAYPNGEYRYRQYKNDEGMTLQRLKSCMSHHHGWTGPEYVVSDVGTASANSDDFGTTIEANDPEIDVEIPPLPPRTPELSIKPWGNVASPEAFSQALSLEQKRCILALYLPATMNASAVMNDETWHLRSATTERVERTFHERFGKCDLRFEDDKQLHGDFKQLVDLRQVLKQEHEDLGSQIEPLVAGQRAITKRRNAAVNASGLLTKSVNQKAAMYAQIHLILGRQGTMLAANGASTYAEITQNSLRQLCKKMKDLEMVVDGSCIMDIGSGIGTALVHMCHELQCNGIGVEYDPNRVYLCAQYFLQLWNACVANPFLRTNVACFLLDILDVNVLGMADILYIYDEAFSGDVMEWLAWLILHSPTIKWVISFKSMRHPDYKNFLEEEAGLVLVDTVDAVKIGSGEGSRAHIYRRGDKIVTRASAKRLSSTKPNQTVLSIATKADEYFEANREYQERYYVSLAREMDVLTKTKRVRIANQPNCYASIFSECVDECPECACVFVHVDGRTLKAASVDWIGGESPNGLFTMQNIGRKRLIIQYRGKVVEDISACTDKRYVMKIGKRYVDAQNRGKQMWVNHSCEPNCCFQQWHTKKGETHVSLASLRDIQSEEELTVDYGPDRERFLCGVCNKLDCKIQRVKGDKNPDRKRKACKVRKRKADTDEIGGKRKASNGRSTNCEKSKQVPKSRAGAAQVTKIQASAAPVRKSTRATLEVSNHQRLHAYTFLCLTSCSLVQVVKIDPACAFNRQMKRLFWPDPPQRPPHCLVDVESSYRQLHGEPYIYTIDDYLTEKELKYFDTQVQTRADDFQDSQVGSDYDSSDSVQKDQRSSSTLAFTTNQDSTIKNLTNQLAALFACEATQVEPLQVVRYLPTQSYGVHHDLGDIDDNGGVILPGTHNGYKRRLVTLFIYLNDVAVDAGGFTHFPYCNLRIKPKRGMAVVWSNINEEKKPDPRTIHEGEPIISGIKYGLNAWICES